ncbi:hypothetical protein FRC02_009642 [Tulasnella sp. 418]|nr:hypothetical protein FRC02_009642 [Tulasnella sp. 418]
MLLWLLIFIHLHRHPLRSSTPNPFQVCRLAPSSGSASQVCDSAGRSGKVPPGAGSSNPPAASLLSPSLAIKEDDSMSRVWTEAAVAHAFAMLHETQFHSLLDGLTTAIHSFTINAITSYNHLIHLHLSTLSLRDLPPKLMQEGPEWTSQAIYEDDVESVDSLAGVRGTSNFVNGVSYLISPSISFLTPFTTSYIRYFGHPLCVALIT